MLVNKAYRYELKPNKSQLVLLKKHAGCTRFAWNWGLVAGGWAALLQIEAWLWVQARVFLFAT